MKRRARLPLLVVVPLAVVMLLASACGAIASPQGWAAPVPTGSGVLTSLHRGKLALTDTSTPGGTTKWEFPPSSDSKTKLQGIYGTPVVANDRVVFGGYNGHVYALKLADGTALWDVNTHGNIVGGPAVAGDTVFIGNADGNFLALSLADGSARGSFKTGERIWSTPVVDAGSVYVTSMDRKVYAFTTADFQGKDAKPQPVWQRKIADGAIPATPSVSGGQLFVGTLDRHLYALDAGSGSERWHSPAANNWFWSRALIANGTAYLGSLDENVYAYDAATGSEKWHQKLTDSIRGEPALVGGVLVVADRKGHIAGFKPDTGEQVWSQDLHSTTLGDLVPAPDGQNILVVSEGGTGGSRLLQIAPADGSVTELQKG